MRRRCIKVCSDFTTRLYIVGLSIVGSGSVMSASLPRSVDKEWKSLVAWTSRTAHCAAVGTSCDDRGVVMFEGLCCS